MRFFEDPKLFLHRGVDEEYYREVFFVVSTERARSGLKIIQFCVLLEANVQAFFEFRHFRRDVELVSSVREILLAERGPIALVHPVDFALDKFLAGFCISFNPLDCIPLFSPSKLDGIPTRFLR